MADEVLLYKTSHALVIGIDGYNKGWPRLSNAVADAERVAEALRQKGFNVAMETDLKSDALEKRLKEFFILKGSDPQTRLFVWFAGHGHTEEGEMALSNPDLRGFQNLGGLCPYDSTALIIFSANDCRGAATAYSLGFQPQWVRATNAP